MQITINAHATLEDIFEWLTPFAETMPLYFAMEVYFPKFRLHPLKRWSEFISKVEKLKARELWIDLVPIPAMRDRVELKYNNKERFFIHLPEYKQNYLREAWFGTVATKAKQLTIWRAIIRAVRKHTTRGMWIRNDIIHTKAFSKRHGYSSRVGTLHDQGLELLPFAGDNRLCIAEPDSA